MPEKRITELFPELPSGIELVVYEFELPSMNMDAVLAKNAGIFNPETDIWLQLLSVPKSLRYGVTGIHYGTEIMDELINRYSQRNAKRICFCFGPKEKKDDVYVRHFYEDNFGFEFSNKVPGYTFGYKELK